MLMHSVGVLECTMYGSHSFLTLEFLIHGAPVGMKDPQIYIPQIYFKEMLLWTIESRIGNSYLFPAAKYGVG